MQTLQQILAEIASGSTTAGIRRLQYLPYKMETALRFIEAIGQKFEPSFRLNDNCIHVYKDLIRYVHGDPEFSGTLEKGILLIGPTGTGKSLAMKIIQTYRTIDDTWYIKDGKPYRMNFDIYPVNEVISRFIESGFDGIEIFCKRYCACFDDIGSEIERVKHYGNDLDVISHVLSERYARQLLTFGTSNYRVSDIEDKYGDRTISRMYSLFNFITMKDIDYRKV